MRRWTTAGRGEGRVVELDALGVGGSVDRAGLAEPGGSAEQCEPVDQLRLRRLERENAELREQNEFLKRAALYFAKPDQSDQ